MEVVSLTDSELPIGAARRDAGFGADSQTYESLLRAAGELIGSRGYHDVTVDDIRRAAGVSRATFYFYFRNKRHIFMKLSDSVMNEMYEVAGRHYPEKDEYSRIILANIAYLSVWARRTKIVGEFFALSLVDGEIREIYGRHRRRFEDRIAGRLSRLMESNRIPPCDPVLLAAALSSMVEFFAFRFFATHEEVSVDRYAFNDAVALLSESWYRAVYGRTPPFKVDVALAEGIAESYLPAAVSPSS
jgi:AcrR family transcriptional regulator